MTTGRLWLSKSSPGAAITPVPEQALLFAGTGVLLQRAPRSITCETAAATSRAASPFGSRMW